MAENGNNQHLFLKGFLIGGIFGALAGIFFAPRSGKELRSKIKEKGWEALKGAEELHKEAKTILEDARRHAEELKKDLAEAGQKVKEILARGEEKEARGAESRKEDVGRRET